MSEQNWTKQNRIFLVRYSCAKVSGPSEVPRFTGKLILVFKEVKCVCVCSIIECSRVQVIASTKQFLEELSKLQRHRLSRFTHAIHARSFDSVKNQFWAQRINTRSKKHYKNARTMYATEPVLRFYKNIQVTCTMKLGLRNPQLISDLKSELDSKSYDDAPISMSNWWAIQLHTLSVEIRIHMQRMNVDRQQSLPRLTGDVEHPWLAL